MPTDKETISRYMASLGSKKSKRKKEATQRNAKKAQAARRTPLGKLEAAYQKQKSGSLTFTQAYLAAHCSFKRYRSFVERRDAGQTLAQIAMDYT